MIRTISLNDLRQICEIYNYYIKNTHISFEESPVSESEMEARIGAIIPSLPWLVYEEQSQILGYAYATKWKGRQAYRHTVESTVYLRPEAGGKGIGSALYKALLAQLQEKAYHTVIGGISLPNEASIRLHEKLGFNKVAHFSQVGYKFNKWVDVGYWEYIFPFRAPGK